MIPNQGPFGNHNFLYLYPRNGVLQGIILFIILFLIKINNIVNAINPDTDDSLWIILLYTLYFGVEFFTHIEHQLQQFKNGSLSMDLYLYTYMDF